MDRKSWHVNSQITDIFQRAEPMRVDLETIQGKMVHSNKEVLHGSINVGQTNIQPVGNGTDCRNIA